MARANSFSHEHGFSVGVDVEVKAQIPFVGESGVTVSSETSHNWAYGSQNTIETTFTVDTPVVVPPGKVYKATATVKNTQMNIPYIGRVHFQDTPVVQLVYGTYRGVDFYQLEQ